MDRLQPYHWNLNLIKNVQDIVVFLIRNMFNSVNFSLLLTSNKCAILLQTKITRLKKPKHGYLILNWSDNACKDNVMNRALPSVQFAWRFTWNCAQQSIWLDFSYYKVPRSQIFKIFVDCKFLQLKVKNEEKHNQKILRENDCTNYSKIMLKNKQRFVQHMRKFAKNKVISWKPYLFAYSTKMHKICSFCKHGRDSMHEYINFNVLRISDKRITVWICPLHHEFNANIIISCKHYHTIFAFRNK